MRDLVPELDRLSSRTQETVNRVARGVSPRQYCVEMVPAKGRAGDAPGEVSRSRSGSSITKCQTTAKGAARFVNAESVVQHSQGLGRPESAQPLGIRK